MVMSEKGRSVDEIVTLYRSRSRSSTVVSSSALEQTNENRDMIALPNKKIDFNDPVKHPLLGMGCNYISEKFDFLFEQQVKQRLSRQKTGYALNLEQPLSGNDIDSGSGGYLSPDNRHDTSDRQKIFRKKRKIERISNKKSKNLETHVIKQERSDSNGLKKSTSCRHGKVRSHCYENFHLGRILISKNHNYKKSLCKSRGLSGDLGQHVKRGPGRPLGSKNKNHSTLSTPKRSPGRTLRSKNQPILNKRGPGRPRLLNNNLSTLKRGPGRPRGSKNKPHLVSQRRVPEWEIPASPKKDRYPVTTTSTICPTKDIRHSVKGEDFSSCSEFFFRAPPIRHGDRKGSIMKRKSLPHVVDELWSKKTPRHMVKNFFHNHTLSHSSGKFKRNCLFLSRNISSKHSRDATITTESFHEKEGLWSGSRRFMPYSFAHGPVIVLL